MECIHHIQTRRAIHGINTLFFFPAGSARHLLQDSSLDSDSDDSEAAPAPGELEVPTYYYTLEDGSPAPSPWSPQPAPSPLTQLPVLSSALAPEDAALAAIAAGRRLQQVIDCCHFLIALMIVCSLKSIYRHTDS